MKKHKNKILALGFLIAAVAAGFGFTWFSCTSGGAIPISGQEVPELSSLDDKMLDLLSKYDLPGAALAVAKSGKLVYARGFGYADKDLFIGVKPDNLFRLASVSKVITGMAMTKLVEDGLVKLDDLVFGSDGILNDTAYQTINDERMKDIRVWHLLTHTSGFPGEEGDDPQYMFVDIANALGETPPASNVSVIKYVLANLPLNFDPGSQYLYSNVGYNVLGRIIAKKSGMTYEDYVRSILEKAGITDMHIAGSLLSDRRENEVIYYDLSYCVEEAYDGSGQMVPCSYGTQYFPTMDSHGGWIASAVDLLKFATAIDGFDNRPSLFRPETIDMMKQIPPGIPHAQAYNSWGIDSSGNWSHAGALTTGTAAYIYRGEDQIEYAVLFNRLPIAQDASFEDILAFFSDVMQITTTLAAVTTWPTHDLFDQY